jgi:two-component system chemotaxis response regulator CheB
VAVVLSGSRDDGSAGVAAVVAHGGVVLVQDPADALCTSMPRAAIQRAPTARVAPAGGLGALIRDLIARLGDHPR